MKTLKLLLMSMLITPTGAFAQNIFTYKVGNCEASMLSEAQQSINTNLLVGATPEMLQECAPDGTIPNAMAAYVVRTPDKVVLVDAGLGTNLFDNLFSLGIKPEEVDVVLITHMHYDHIGGLLRDGKVMFPNAELYVPKPEYDYWKHEKSQGGEYARKIFDAYNGQVNIFLPEDGLIAPSIPDFQAMAAYGHTPGHTMYLLSSNEEQLLFWGDVTHAMAIQMPYPQVALTYDVDPTTAIATREAVLEYVAKNNIAVAGMHIAFPGMGNIKKSNKGYIFMPLE